jgi:hypothetical protein
VYGNSGNRVAIILRQCLMSNRQCCELPAWLKDDQSVKKNAEKVNILPIVEKTPTP